MLMKRDRLFKFFSSIVVMMLLCMPVSFVYAASDYTTDLYTINTVVHEDHSMDVIEKIVVDFGNSAHHGIYRYVPYVSGKYTIEDVNVRNEEAETSSESSNGHEYTLIKIGDADKTVTGKHTFNITYKIISYGDRDTSKDTFSYNLFPTMWETSIKNVKSTITMPKAVNKSAYKFYGGENYSTTMPSYFKTSVSNNGKTITLTGTNIPAKTGATVNANLKEGYWIGAPDHMKGTLFVIIGFILLPLLVIIMWVRHGRDPQVVETVEFHAPEGMTPVDVGYVIDSEVDTKDVSSLLMYFASQGLVTFEEREIKKKKNHLIVHKVKDISQSEKSYVKDFFKDFFVKKDMDLKKLPESISDAFTSTKTKVEDYYSSGEESIYDGKADVCRILSYVLMMISTLVSAAFVGYYDYDLFSYFILGFISGALLCYGMFSLNQGYDRRIGYSKAKAGIKFIIGTIVIIIGICIHSFVLMVFEDGVLILLFIISTIVIVIFSMLMRALTPHGAEVVGKVRGFKNFIATAEYDRLKMLSNENPEYFFDILPYAYVMGMDKTWAKKFDKIKVPKPSWYTYDEYDAMSDIFFYDMLLNDMHMAARDVDSMIVKDSASSAMSDFSGGSGGGDFSGGGFGGGGGGAW